MRLLTLSSKKFSSEMFLCRLKIRNDMKTETYKSYEDSDPTNPNGRKYILLKK